MVLKTIILFFLFCILILGKGVGQNIDRLFSEAISTRIQAGDSTAKLQVHKINITGNIRTREHVILREFRFREGDSIIISSLVKELENAQKNVYNTQLFAVVKIEPVIISAYQIDVNVVLTERWYIYPSPLVRLADRNFSVWLHTYNVQVDRLNYGVKFDHFNFTGNKDVLSLMFLTGYSNSFSFSYNQPYANASMNSGFGVSGKYVTAKEVGYKTSYANKTLNYDTSYFINKVIGGSFRYYYRKGIKERHTWILSYLNASVDDSVLKYNPNYFNSISSKQNILDFIYSYQYTDLDNVAYPLKGSRYTTNIIKRGLGFTGGQNMLSIDGNYKKYWQLNKWLYADVSLYGNIKLPFYQPYINQHGLGYGDNFLRGLQDYVVDGVMTGYMKSTLRAKVLGLSFPVPHKSVFHRFLPFVPFNFYAKIFTDWGTVYNKPEFSTSLSNKFLYTGGIGLDLLTIYDCSAGVEFCLNQLNQKGVFLQLRSGF